MAEKKGKIYVSDNAQLMAEWNWEKNNKLGLYPNELTRGSTKKVWWQCAKEHEWESAIKERSKTNGTKCPFCSSNKVLEGFNDLASQFPEIATEWHPFKNGRLKPTLVTAKSSKRIWWKCRKGHEWQVSIANRTMNNSACPYCSGKKILAGYNDLSTVNPILATEWHSIKNDKLTPQMVGTGSDKIVWWKCKKGHEWKAAIKDRNHGNGCPYCSGRLPIVGKTDLLTNSPDIAIQWHPTKNGSLLPSDVTVGSNKKIWWICNEGHEWQAPVHHRKNAGCPYCSNKKLLVGFNDLSTTHPELAAQWHPTKNGDLTAQMVTYGSTQTVWWKCKNGHEWIATPNQRTNKEQHSLLNCPVCSSELKTSFAEQALFYYLKKHVQAYNRMLVYGKEIDIWLPQLNVGVEHDGKYFHQDVQKDYKKIEFFAKHGVRIITVRESEKDSLEGDKIEYQYQNTKALNKAISLLFVLLDIDVKIPIDVANDSIHIQNQYVQLIKENSLSEKYPNLAAEWHPTKNEGLEPNQFSCGSHKKVWWKGSCGHEWQQIIKNRVSVGSGCPICSGREVLSGFNDLLTVKPDIACLWNYSKNGELTPSQITPFSGKKVWWICEKGHEWETTVATVASGSKCPYCANKKVLQGYNDLETTHPQLAVQWHPSLNGDLTPQKITYGSTKNVWWKCENGHEWQASPNKRTNANSNCPICKKIESV